MTSSHTCTKLHISLFLNLTVIIMELIALVQSAAAHGLSLFRFYTEDSNLFALFTSILFAVFLLKHKQSKAVPSWMGTLKYISVCCLSVTFIVVVTVLAPMTGSLRGYNRMLLEGSMLYHHFLCPVIAAFSFLFFDPIPPIRKKDTFFSLIPTLCYAIITMLLNVAKLLDGPYPFLRVYNQPIYLSCIWFVVILGLAYLLSWLLRIGYQRLHRSQYPHDESQFHQS